MIGKPVALIQVPNQRLFSVRCAARYLGVHEQTVRKLTALGELEARRFGKRRAYTLESLDAFIGCFFREVLLIVSSNLGKHDLTLDSWTLLSGQTCAEHGTCLPETIRGNCTP